MTQTQSRSRTYTWDDPSVTAALAGRRPGLELLRAMGDGELPPPPILALIDIERMTAEDGHVTFWLRPQEFHYNPIGSVHGGVAATLLDSAMGAAVHSTLPQGSAYVTLEVKFNLVRPITADTGRVIAEGKVIHAGRSVATVEGSLRSAADGKLLAHGTSTCLMR